MRRPRLLLLSVVAGVCLVGIIIDVIHYHRQQDLLSRLQTLRASQILQLEVLHASERYGITDSSAIEAFARAINLTEPLEEPHQVLIDDDFYIKIVISGYQQITLEVLIDRYSPGVALVYYRDKMNGKWQNHPLLDWIRVQVPTKLTTVN